MVARMPTMVVRQPSGPCWCTRTAQCSKVLLEVTFNIQKTKVRAPVPWTGDCPTRTRGRAGSSACITCLSVDQGATGDILTIDQMRESRTALLPMRCAASDQT